jgi:3-hydroxyisobutyrate dehydrogenase
MAGMSSGDARTAVAVIGAGIMGSAMTRNLVAAGLNTRVWDRSTSATASLADAGAVVAASTRDAVVNAYLSILIEGVAETMELADRPDIGHQELAEVIGGGPLAAPIADAKLRKMDEGDFAAEFPLEWAVKDVDLAIGAAPGDVPPLLGALSVQWHAAVAAGHGRQYISAAGLALGNPSAHGMSR